MVKHYKLKDGTVIKEASKGTFSLILPNKRYVTFTTWGKKVWMNVPSMGPIDMGDN